MNKTLICLIFLFTFIVIIFIFYFLSVILIYTYIYIYFFCFFLIKCYLKLNLIIAFQKIFRLSYSSFLFSLFSTIAANEDTHTETPPKIKANFVSDVSQRSHVKIRNKKQKKKKKKQ